MAQGAQAVTSTKPWYKRWWGIILIIIFWPIGLPVLLITLLWQKTSLGQGVKVGITAIIIVIFGAITLSFAGTPPSETTGQQVTGNGAQTANSVANTPAQPEKKEEPKQPEAPKFPEFRDGIHEVGKDIQPGTYRTRIASAGCYFSRLRGFGGTIGEIISNENTDSPAVVTIAPTDKGFTSTRCGVWTQDLSAIIDGNSFADGTYIIGTDIQPGTYKSEGGESCYYVRLRGFGGGVSDIIANENTDSAAIVTIGSKDKGFSTTRCGKWTKMK